MTGSSIAASRTSKALAPLAVLLAYSAALAYRSEPASARLEARSLDESKRLAETLKNLLYSGQYKDALQPALQLYAASPGNQIYIRNLANIYHELGRFADEAAMWEQFMQKAPMPTEGCPQIGKAYERLNRLPDAIAAYENCLVVDPEKLDSLFDIGHAYEMMGRVSQAEDKYREGAAKSPGNLDFTVGLARLCLRRNKLEEAKKIAAGVVRRNTSNTDAMLVLGLANWREGKVAEAKTWLVRGVQTAGQDAEFHMLLAQVAESQRDYAEARRQYARVIELEPGNLEAAKRRVNLEIARR